MTEPTSSNVARRYAAVTVADSAFPVVFRSASGCHVEDFEGKRYIDFISGYGVVSTGWQRPEVAHVFMSPRGRTVRCTGPGHVI